MLKIKKFFVVLFATLLCTSLCPAVSFADEITDGGGAQDISTDSSEESDDITQPDVTSGETDSESDLEESSNDIEDSVDKDSTLEVSALYSSNKIISTYRFYNPFSGEHFYTQAVAEGINLYKLGWKYEGIAWYCPVKSSTPVYRLYNSYSSDHHYTTSKVEYDSCISNGWTGEGIAWYSDDAKGVPLYRGFNPYVDVGTHHYALAKAEIENMVSNGWVSEGYAWYGASTIGAVVPKDEMKAAIDNINRPPASTASSIYEAYNPYSNETMYTTSYAEYSNLLSAGWKGDGAPLKSSSQNKTPVYRIYMKGEGRHFFTTSLAEKNSIVSSGSTYEGVAFYANVNGAGHVYRVYNSHTDEHFITSNRSEYDTLIAKGFSGEGIAFSADSLGNVSYKSGYQNPGGYYQLSSHSMWLEAHMYTSSWSYVSPSRISVSSTRSQCIETFINRALEYVGTPYVWNYSRQPGVGVDCVGLVYQAAYSCGMDLGDLNPYNHMATGSSGYHSHDAKNLWETGKILKLPISSRARGDLIFSNGSMGYHVAIYLGDGKIVEAAKESVKVMNSIYNWGNAIVGVGRIFL